MSKNVKAGVARESPRDARDKLFCERWLEHFDHIRAYQEAGFKGTRTKLSVRAKNKLERFAAYLTPLQQAKAQIVAQKVVTSQDDVLKAMARVAFVNPLEYYVKTDFPVTRKRKVKEKINDVVVETEVEEPVVVAGCTIYQVRAKQINELTPEQLSAVEVHHHPRTGELTWRLPDLHIRTVNRKMLGQNVGLFLEKVILQNQTNTTNVQLNVQAIPSDKLTELVHELLPLVGAEFAQFLGFTMEEIEAAKPRVIEHQPT